MPTSVIRRLADSAVHPCFRIIFKMDTNANIPTADGRQIRRSKRLQEQQRLGSPHHPVRDQQTSFVSEPDAAQRLTRKNLDLFNKLAGTSSGATPRSDQMARSSETVSTTASGFAIQAEKTGSSIITSPNRLGILMKYAQNIQPPARQTLLLNPNSTIIPKQ